MDAPALKAQLEALCSTLSGILKEHPADVEALCNVARPQLGVPQQHAALNALFENLSAVLNLENSEFVSYLESPPSDAAGLLLLLDFRSLALFLARISFHHLIVLSDPNLIPEQDLQVVRHFMGDFQRLLSSMPDQLLENTRTRLLESPEYLQMSVLNEFLPQVPSNLSLVIAASLLVPDEVCARAFIETIRTASDAELDQLSKLLTHFPISFLIDLKEKLCIEGRSGAAGASWLNDGPSNWNETGLNVSLSDIQLVDPADLMTTQDVFQFFEQSELDVLEQPTDGTIGMDTAAWDALFPQTVFSTGDASTPLDTPLDAGWAAAATVKPSVQPTEPAATLASSSYELRMAIQPPAQLVYQRIVKPNPTVMMVAGDMSKDHFVRATLVRADSDTEVVNVLEGTLVERISTTSMAQFRRLKIISTSQMQGTLFRLKFSLEVFEESFVSTGICIFTSPIEVFSHTQYVKPNRNAPTPPVILEVLPVSGKPGTRVAVIGSNFLAGDHLAVRFGQMATRPQLHGPGTLICSAPSHPPALVEVAVTNDGVHFTRSVSFQYR